ncbi:MAG: MoxR family ATPase [Chloroflexota bacterium]|nr:MoxR family ATPase [Chloroflexota bacterium]MDE2970438.1 MoxR family ATPase [Chloroflexota bacterium]
MLQDGASPQAKITRLIDNVSRVILGKREAVEHAVIALLCGGHVLIEDVPGVGKTMLARSVARSTGCSFGRIQFTPDLLPSDITGVSVYNQQSGEFEFRPGPIMAQMVLADELNRTTPKTQSALLEAMEEHQVTVDGVTHPLPRPAMVLATLNPIEYEGTFPLPEGQLDRFMLRISLGYPDAATEVSVVEQQVLRHPIEALEPVVSPEEVVELQEHVRQIHADRTIMEYAVALAQVTRRHPEAELGASPRGSLALFRVSQALALLRGRDYVLPDDVKGMAVSVLAHRVIVPPSARMRGLDGRTVVEGALEEVAVPGARSGQRAPAR